MAQIQDNINSSCSINNTTFSNCSIASIEPSKMSNDTGCCDTESKNYENDESKPHIGRNLIINYLPQDMTELDLYQLFSRIGGIESCKLVRSKVTKQSLGYAFVKYIDGISASKAVDEFNGMKINDKKIKVSLARPSRPEIKDANLYVGGLPNDCNETQLRRIFGKYGDIISCRVIQPTERTADYHFGFVRFDTNEQAHKAMQELHGKIPPTEIFQSSIFNFFVTLTAVTGPLTVKFARTPNVIENQFSMHPHLLSSLLPTAENLLSEQFAGISLSGKQASAAAKSDEDHLLPLCGKMHSNYYNSLINNQSSSNEVASSGICCRSYNCTCEKSTSGSSQDSNAYLVLANLPYDFTEIAVYRLCNRFGAIEEVKVFIEDKECFSIVLMCRRKDAEAAASKLNGLILEQFSPVKAIVV